MKYKIQFKYETQCGEWDDLLNDEHYKGQGAEPIVGTHETMTEYDSIEDANAQIEIEKDNYRDSYDHLYSAEDIESYMPAYRIIPSHLKEENETYSVKVSRPDGLWGTVDSLSDPQWTAFRELMDNEDFEGADFFQEVLEDE
tara:strand:+ start:639 stop:1064 length:426 start_codon:yes stop_codon:yes gene_type:complete